MQTELDVLKQVCSLLGENGIPYMLTGSFAANLYAAPRMTRDIDIVIEMQLKDTDKFFRVFKEAFYVDRNAIFEAIKNQTMFNIIHQGQVLKIDFVIRKATEYRQVEFERKKRIAIDEISIWIVSPEGLIISKLYWAKDSISEVQIKDIINIFHAVPQLDQDYIREWVKKLNLNSIYEKVSLHA